MKFRNVFQTEVKMMRSFYKKVSSVLSVSAMFINRQRRSYLKWLVMILWFDEFFQFDSFYV